jgi:hypothetical protein
MTEWSFRKIAEMVFSFSDWCDKKMSAIIAERGASRTWPTAREKCDVAHKRAQSFSERRVFARLPPPLPALRVSACVRVACSEPFENIMVRMFCPFGASRYNCQRGVRRRAREAASRQLREPLFTCHRLADKLNAASAASTNVNCLIPAGLKKRYPFLSVHSVRWHQNFLPHGGEKEQTSHAYLHVFIDSH